MAINLPIVTEFSDKGIKAARAAFANFKTDVGAAQGAMGKFKAGSNSALSAVKANAGNFAMAAGAALVGFGVKAISAFQDLALASGRFADATGLSVEEASRFIEVGGDLKIEADAMQAAIGKMNKTLGTSPELFAELGVDVVKTDDGLTDVNATFLKVIGRLKGIKDPTERARVGALLLGKGWQSMSQLVELGSVKLKRALDGVSSSQVISAKELKKAQEFRDTMDDLGDIWSGVLIEAGGALVDVINGLSKAQGYFNDPMSAFRDIGNGVLDFFRDAPDEIKVYAKELTAAREDSKMMNEALKELKDGGFDGFVFKSREAAVAVASVASEWKALTDQFKTQTSIDEAVAKLDALKAAGDKAFKTGKDADITKYVALFGEMVGDISDIAQSFDKISSKEILMTFKAQGSAAALALAQWLARGAELGGLTQEQLLTFAGISTNTPKKAMGGPVTGGSSYLVGERGMELFTPSSSGTITPNGGLGGTTNNITINTSADPQAVVQALQQFNRMNGPIPINTRGN